MFYFAEKEQNAHPFFTSNSAVLLVGEQKYYLPSGRVTNLCYGTVRTVYQKSALIPINFELFCTLSLNK